MGYTYSTMSMKSTRVVPILVTLLTQTGGLNSIIWADKQEGLSGQMGKGHGILVLLLTVHLNLNTMIRKRRNQKEIPTLKTEVGEN